VKKSVVILIAVVDKQSFVPLHTLPALVLMQQKSDSTWNSKKKEKEKKDLLTEE